MLKKETFLKASLPRMCVECYSIMEKTHDNKRWSCFCGYYESTENRKDFAVRIGKLDFLLAKESLFILDFVENRLYFKMYPIRLRSKYKRNKELI